jgi:hypothetical protein
MRVHLHRMIAKLQNWSLHSRPPGQWQSPEEDGGRVFGFVFGNPRHLDGKELLTSAVMRCSANHIVTRSGSEYELGSIDPAYERRYPDALQRLFAHLKKGTMDRVRAPEPRLEGGVPRMRRFLLSLGCKQRAS